MNELNPILAFSNTQNIDYYNYVIANPVFEEEKPVIYSSYYFSEEDSMYYIHTDHLGSYIALTNANRQVRQRNWFDPWGNKRNSFLWNWTDHSAMSITTRGFTGHEHYPCFKIINMNGRLYDPVIGRFFLPDKYVANSSFTQDFNRYTYARNCPLMYTDPDGEIAWFIPLIAIGVSAIVSAASYTIQVAASPGGFQNWS
jgi:RHS repeat-associated protein